MTHIIEIQKTHRFCDLVCPISKKPLIMNKNQEWLYAVGTNLAYPIRNQIPVMLASEARALTDDERAVLKYFT
ncbi:MAG: hypothetical protein ACJAQ0_001499 [Dasania sp.]|jgi:uncharacterized protein YbaR (Trm112 family)